MSSSSWKLKRDPVLSVAANARTALLLGKKTKE
jgi:hypothetical protein